MNQLPSNYVHLSPEDPIEQLNLTNRSFNAFKRVDIRTVGEVLQLFELGRLQTIPGLGRKSVLELKNKLAQVKISSDSEVETNTETFRNQDDVFLSREDPIEQLDLTVRSFNALTRANIRTVGEVLQLIASDELQTLRGLGRKSISQIKDELAQVKILGDSEVEVNTAVIPIQHNLFLAREEPIRQLNLSRHSFNSLTSAGIQTVGDIVQLIESVRLQTIRELGTKCILEITAILPQVKILNGDEVESWVPSDVWSQLIVKIVNDAEIESITKTGNIPKRVVRTQSQLVSKQLLRELLHKDAVIAEKSIKDWLSEIETIESNQAHEVLEAILGASINICEEIEFFLNQIPGQHCIPVLLSMYGLERKNLRQTGDELGISRERVRQIRSELKEKVTSISNLKAKPALHRIQSALLIAEDLGLDITYEQWAQRIRSSGLVGDWTAQAFVGTAAVEGTIAICNLLADCQIRWLQMPKNLQYAVQLAAEGKPNIPAKILHAVNTLSDQAKRLINRHRKFSGGVYARWLSQEMEMELEEITDILHGLGYRALSKGWFIPRIPRDPHRLSKHDVFHHGLRKMFQYCGPLDIDDICAGLRHVLSRTRFPVPPPDVTDEIIRICDYICEDDLYYWDGAYDEHLNEGEIIIMNCLERTGPVFHHVELIQAFIESDLSFPSLHGTLKRTPLFHTIEFGLYKLRGREVTYQDIERAQAAGERQSLRPEVKYDMEGNIIVSVTLSTIAVGSGTILCERFPDLSGEDWECYVGSERADELNAVENEFRRLKKPFELLNCQPGDRVKFTFNTWERRVTIEKEEGNAES